MIQNNIQRLHYHTSQGPNRRRSTSLCQSWGSHPEPSYDRQGLWHGTTTGALVTPHSESQLGKSSAFQDKLSQNLSNPSSDANF